MNKENHVQYRRGYMYPVADEEGPESFYFICEVFSPINLGTEACSTLSTLPSLLNYSQTPKAAV